MDGNLDLMERKRIAILGAGQLGSRHLQALALLDETTEIYVVDPSSEGREIAQQRFEQIEGHQKHDLKLYSSLVDIEKSSLDLVIVATNSGIRAKVTEELLEVFQVNYLVLEKFLFQKESEYHEIGQLIKQHGVKAFVNCPRRMFPTYRKIKDLIKDPADLQMEVIGNSWGLGCNSIHFIDLFQWLTGDDISNWTDYLDSGYIAGKRPGYIEFSGRMEGIGDKGHKLSLTSYNGGKPNISVRLSTSDKRFVIEEGLGKVWQEIISEEELKLTEYNFESKFQSALTNVVARQLFETGSCELTPFDDSVRSHLPFLSAVLGHYNQTNEHKSKLCPIT
jgi:predicted CoA-binding protein